MGLLAESADAAPDKDDAKKAEKDRKLPHGHEAIELRSRSWISGVVADP